MHQRWMPRELNVEVWSRHLCAEKAARNDLVGMSIYHGVVCLSFKHSQIISKQIVTCMNLLAQHEICSSVGRQQMAATLTFAWKCTGNCCASCFDCSYYIRNRLMEIFYHAEFQHINHAGSPRRKAAVKTLWSKALWRSWDRDKKCRWGGGSDRNHRRKLSAVVQSLKMQLGSGGGLMGWDIVTAPSSIRINGSDQRERFESASGGVLQTLRVSSEASLGETSCCPDSEQSENLMQSQARLVWEPAGLLG